MRLRTTTAAMLLLTASWGGMVAAQDMPQLGMDARTQAIGDMSEAQVLAALQSDGRVAMSGTFFETGSAALTAKAANVIAKLAGVLRALPDARLAVVGHTDNTGDFNANLTLSEKRAQAIVTALTADDAIDASRLVAVGVGSIDPIASNMSQEGKALNRRVSFVLISEAEALGAASGADGSWLQDPVTNCMIWTTGDSVAGEGAAWTGSCINGMANGRGSLVFWDAKGFEARYDGDVLNGKADGAGKVWYRNDDGSFDSMEGSFKSGEPIGEITIRGASGYTFEGELLAGTDHGVGKLTTPEGWVVDGEVKDGNGVGPLVVYYESDEGELYFGDAENNKRHGFGTLVSADDNSYVGQFENGSPSGSGMFESANGSQFLGQFTDGSPNGVGTSLDPDGTSYQGRFVNGKPDGIILVTAPDGAQSTQTWKDGEQVE